MLSVMAPDRQGPLGNEWASRVERSNSYFIVSATRQCGFLCYIAAAPDINIMAESVGCVPWAR